MSRRQLLLLLAPFLILFGAGATLLVLPTYEDHDHAHASIDSSTRVLELVVINPPSSRKFRRTARFAEYLSRELRPTGYRVEAMRLDRIEDVIARARAGGAEMFFETPLGYYAVAREVPYTVLGRGWRHGVPEYSSLIVVPRESEVTTLEDLIGKTIGFNDPGSTSTYFLPRHLLVSAGIDLVETASMTTQSYDDVVRYVFSSGTGLRMAWLRSGEIDATAMSNIDWQDLSEDEREALRVVTESDPVPRTLLGVHSRIEGHVQRSLRDILLRMHESAEGREVLEQMRNIARFDELPNESAMQVRMNSVLDAGG